MVALLDVNVLVALFDPDHIHHEVAHDWFADHRHAGWATCPITENGFVRVLANPAYAGTVARTADVVSRLRQFCQGGGHEFWPDTPSLCDDSIFDDSLVSGHRQLTDIYLLAVAHARGGCLATFDRGIPIRAAKGATAASLMVVAPAD